MIRNQDTDQPIGNSNASRKSSRTSTTSVASAIAHRGRNQHPSMGRRGSQDAPMHRRACRSEHAGAIREQLRHGQDRVEVQLWVGSACATKRWARGKPKAVEDLRDRRLLGDGGDDAKLSAAFRTRKGVDGEHTAKKSSPVQVRARGRDAPTIGSLRFGLRSGRRARKRGRHVRGLGHRRRLRLARACLRVLGVFGFGHDVLTPSRRARQHAHVPNQGMPRWGYQARETRKKLHRFHQQMCPASPWVLHLVGDPPALVRPRRDKLMG